MRVLVCGGRDYHDFHTVGRELLDLHEKTSITELLHGGAPGADTQADRWARAHNIPVRVFPADWNLHGKVAGPIRNQAMLEVKPELVVAFPGGRGTADMVRRARAAGIAVLEVPARTLPADGSPYR